MLTTEDTVDPAHMPHLLEHVARAYRAHLARAVADSGTRDVTVEQAFDRSPVPTFLKFAEAYLSRLSTGDVFYPSGRLAVRLSTGEIVLVLPDAGAAGVPEGATEPAGAVAITGRS